MNDTELDEMLDRWQAPAMRESVGDDVWARVPKRRTARVRVMRIAVATLAAAAVLFAVIQVSPRTVRMAPPDFHISYYVEFIFTRFGANGSVEYQSRHTAFPYGGILINMSVTQIDDSVFSKFREIAASIRTQFVLAVPSLVLPKQPPMEKPVWFDDYVRNGCTRGMTVAGHETVAGYPTTVIVGESPVSRMKVWLAPDLQCADLKMTVEVREGGGYRMVSRRDVIKVTMNP
jgi:hypothetical protein